MKELQRLGKSRLIRRLAVGGMAEVYLAVAEGLSGFEKRVVVKRLHPQHARDPELLAMFLDEARLMARLRHPHVAEVYDIGQDGEDYYFTMEHVRGEDVREILRFLGGAPLPLPQALTIITRLGRGLDHAHELRDDEGKPLGIVHRDVSPSNVIVTIEGGVKLIDFGVAKWTAQRSETRHGTLKGKVAYMSPEQCRAEVIDRRSDVFALGVMLYELTTGVRPFSGSSDFEVLSAIVRGQFTPPGRVRGDYPAALESIVVRALAADREARFPTALALAEAVESFARDAGLSLGEAHLAAYLKGLFGQRIEDWPTTQRIAVASDSAQSTAGRAPTLPAVPGPRDRTQTDVAAEPVAPVVKTEVRTRRWVIAVAGVAAAGLLVAVSSWGLASNRRPPADSARAARPAVVVPPPAVAIPAAGTPAPVVEPPAPAAVQPARDTRPRVTKPVVATTPPSVPPPSAAPPDTSTPPAPPVTTTTPAWDPDSPLLPR